MHGAPAPTWPALGLPQEQPGGTLRVRYSGVRRVQLLLAAQQEPHVVAAAEWFDDGEVAPLDPTVDVLEGEAAKLLQQASPRSGGSCGRVCRVCTHAPWRAGACCHAPASCCNRWGAHPS